jgi:hypothetical protein
MSSVLRLAPAIAALLFWASSAAGAPFFFSTGNPDGLIATASRPDSAGKTEIESADDFVLSGATTITGAAFTGLVPLGSTATDVIVEIYRVFPNESTAPPSGQVPTRVNSPSDIAFDSRDFPGQLAFSTGLLSASFTAANSVVNGINPIPNQTTGGEGPVTGQEVLFSVSFLTPLSLPADHYFFVPQVTLDSGDFLWLSAPRPIVSPGTPFFPDLQSWIRNAALEPDWLRIGGDIVGPPPQGGAAPTFNAAFTLIGQVPEPATLLLLAVGLVVVWWGLKKRKP